MTALKLATLTAAARAVLADTIDAALEADIDAGRAELYELDAGASYAVTRLEVFPDRRELVVCAYAGRDLRAFAELAVDAARRRGCDSIRWHTRRPGLARLLAAYEPELAEFVYRVRLVDERRAAA